MIALAQVLVSFGAYRPGDVLLDVEEETVRAWAAKGLVKVVCSVDPAEVVPNGAGENTDDAKPSRRASRSKTGNGGGDATLPASGGEQG